MQSCGPSENDPLTWKETTAVCLSMIAPFNMAKVPAVDNEVIHAGA